MSRPKTRPKTRFKTVGILLHPHRCIEGDLAGAIEDAVRYLTRFARVVLDDTVPRRVHPPAPHANGRTVLAGVRVEVAPREAILDAADLIVTYGGDGSLIAAGAALRDSETCLVGINAGHLGFLTEGNLEEAGEILRGIFEGKPWIDRRLRLTARVTRQGRQVLIRDAVNDVVVRQGRTNSLLELDARVDGVELITFRSDGVIASTPSGSTAYALSAGGPIVHPSLSCFLLVPIAPFTLSARPLLIPTRGVIELEVRSRHHDATISFDGQRNFDLASGDLIEIRESEVAVQFIRVRRDDFYRTLREKLGWQRTY